MNKTKEIAIIGVLAAFGAILSYIEAILSLSIGIPGVKLGLANIAVVVALYLYGNKSALLVNIVRIIIVGLLFGNVFSIMFSAAGAIVSFASMILLKRMNLFSALGVSTAGGVAHNIGQIIVASIVVDRYSIIYYMPALFIAGIITGVLIGFISKLLLKYIPRKI